MAPPLNGATSEDRATADRYVRNPHFETPQVSHSTRRPGRRSRGYLPRAVFFFGFGFLVFPVLPGPRPFLVASVTPAPSFPGWQYFAARWFALARRLPLAQRGDRKYRSASPACQSTEPSAPRPETAIVNGCCKPARPAKVARRCVPFSLSRATAASRLSQQTTRQESGSASADHSTPN